LPRLGILGGTFDPPHNGHIAIARAALKECNLQKIIFIPAKYPPHKPIEKVTSEPDRLNMLKLAVKDHAEFEVSDIELKRDGLSYTIETLREIRKRNPGIEIVFIIGADNISEMESWFKPDEILNTATVVAFNRPGFAPAGRFKSLIKMFKMPPVNISSTEIREKVKAGKTVSELVPIAVNDYLRNNSLYKD